MNTSEIAVGFALLVGSVRALQLWRAGTNVEVVNVIALRVLSERRARDLAGVLAGSGSALYFDVVRSISDASEKLSASEPSSGRKVLEREALSALILATRKLRRFIVLDYVALLTIAYIGISAVTGSRPSALLALGLLAATLLWLANLYAARNIATRMYAGAFALVEGIVAIFKQRAERELDRCQR